MNAAPTSLVRVTSGRAAASPREAPSRLRRAATFARLAASDVAAIAGAAAALLPLLRRRRPLGRAPEEVAPSAAGEPEGRLLPR